MPFEVRIPFRDDVAERRTSLGFVVFAVIVVVVVIVALVVYFVVFFGSG